MIRTGIVSQVMGGEDIGSPMVLCREDKGDSLSLTFRSKELVPGTA